MAHRVRNFSLQPKKLHLTEFAEDTEKVKTLTYSSRGDAGTQGKAIFDPAIAGRKLNT